MLLVAIAVVAAWALVPGLRQGTKPPDQAAMANASVVMYSLTTCGYCNAKRAELRAAGIPFVEYFVDTDQERYTELTTKLRNAGYRGGGIGTPTFDVNGKMLLNNPSLETIIKHL
ncbi:Glutaredoxin [compost metagenome]